MTYNGIAAVYVYVAFSDTGRPDRNDSYIIIILIATIIIIIVITE